MRRIILGVAMLLTAQSGFGQAVRDNAVIPVSITLNAILRLSVTSGGNIQFVVNTIEQYESGIGNSSQYTTTFQVASSRNFEVNMGAEDPQFIGIETGSLLFSLDNLGYRVDPGTSTGTVDPLVQPLVSFSALDDIVTGNAGGTVDHTYRILWELGTGGNNMNGATLLSQSLAPDIYVTNVFLDLVPL